MYLLTKYIKCVLWRVAKCLSYIEDARCLKVNDDNQQTVVPICVNPKYGNGSYTHAHSNVISTIYFIIHLK